MAFKHWFKKSNLFIFLSFFKKRVQLIKNVFDIFIFRQLTAKRKGADKNGNHNIPHSEETTQKIKSKSKTTKTPVIIETLTKALNGTNSKKMDEEYKVFWFYHLSESKCCIHNWIWIIWIRYRKNCFELQEIRILLGIQF